MNGKRVRYANRPGLTRLRGVVVLTVLSLLMLGGPGSAAAQDPAAISIDPGSGPAGTHVRVSGTGFEGNCSVTIWFGESTGGVAIGGATPDVNGAFLTDAAIPSSASVGPHVIVAVGLAFGNEFCSTPTERTARAEFRVIAGEGELVPRFVPVKPLHTEITGGFSTTEAHLKFVQGSDVRLREGFGFVSLSHDELLGLGPVLAAFPEVVPSRLFSARSEEELSREKARLEAKSGREQGDKNLYFLLTYPESTDAEALLDALNALAVVEIAYPVPREGPDPSHLDYRGNQGYREAAPGGVAADAAMTVPGGRGSNVQVIDIERFFNEDHDDLPTVTTFANGDVDAAFDPPYDHGTAVLGEVFGEDNGFGVLGVADQATPGFVTTAGGRADAIDIATANSDAGDVLLLELQRGGPNGDCDSDSQFGCVPEEFVQASYDAIVAAVADGIVVVAAAGNGSQDLDSDDYDATFGTRPDSGAIIVGAGGAPDCTDPPRGRLDFSNFGSRVNLQGWGECVASTGYGTAEGSPDSNDAYTFGFSGTSSATPIVAAAAAVVSSVAQQQGDADGLSSTEARQLLIDTGTPQDTGSDALAGHIGPLPNLADALGLEADLAISKSDTPDPVAAGDNLTYTVTVTNDGPNVAIDATLVDALPDEVAFISADGDCAHEPTHDVVCDLGDIADGASVDVEIVVLVPADLVFDAGAPFEITNSATATSTIDDPDSINSTDTAVTTVVAVADLQVDAVVTFGLPGQSLIGDDHAITVRSTVRNLGPSSPIDAELETTGTPSAGATVVPGSDTAAVNALVLDTPRVIDQAFTVSCTAPGDQEVVFDVEIRPANAADTDPIAGNNTGQATAEVECVVPIAINIRPGNQFNQVNLNGNGVIEVAALTTVAGEYGLPVAFDATKIVPGSVRFGDADSVWAETGGAAVFNGLVNVHDWHELDDKSKDGDLDMRLSFKTPDTGIQAGATEACMKGEYVDGGQTFTFFGCDFVDVKP